MWYFLGGDSFAAREDHGEDKGQEGHQQVEHQGREGQEAGQDQGMDHDLGHHEDHHVEDHDRQEDHGRQEDLGQDNHGQDYQDGGHDDQQQSQEYQHFDENQVSQVIYLFNYVLKEIKKYYYIIWIKSRRGTFASFLYAMLCCNFCIEMYFFYHSSLEWYYLTLYWIKIFVYFYMKIFRNIFENLWMFSL